MVRGRMAAAGRAAGRRENRSCETLIATSRPRRVSRARVRLAHAARADQGTDFVGAESCSCRERHMEFQLSLPI